jgi:hypothetical protein
VNVNKMTLTRPDEPNMMPAKAVPGKGTLCPEKARKRTMAIGRTRNVYAIGYLHRT